MKKQQVLLATVILTALLLWASVIARAADNRIYIGLNAEFGHPTSTSDDAIRQGMLTALDEINRAGGLLGGRRLELVEKDNRSVPARALQNNRELAAMPDLAAVFCGKFSSAIIESLPFIHQAGLLTMVPWAANDMVVHNGYNPNYVFRLSITDTWAIEAMMRHARAKGYRKVGLLLANTSWGRSNLEAARKYVATDRKIKITAEQWYNYGEKSLQEKYDVIRKSGAQAVMLIAIETEGALFVRELAQLPPKERLPVISHASITGGDFPRLTGDALNRVDLVFAQTDVMGPLTSEKAQAVLSTAQRLFTLKGPGEIKSPMGFAHAYDLTHILALAISKAGSTDRKAIRDALEKLGSYAGLSIRYERPFTETKHDALGPKNIFMARYNKKGIIEKIR